MAVLSLRSDGTGAGFVQRPRFKKTAPMLLASDVNEQHRGQMLMRLDGSMTRVVAARKRSEDVTEICDASRDFGIWDEPKQAPAMTKHCVLSFCSRAVAR
ncbi:hypothetical protein CKO42_03550 [Lamprobacter modestohalophilus]|uniref:Uncharacterized protein n=1 Tax=Lamprobacter modestohalophilus TaxID=1064514 RepID=A0A9X0W669_9GAMM|nr:hypothetical protein [Lamprobacter modestohalophilus]